MWALRGCPGNHQWARRQVCQVRLFDAQEIYDIENLLGRKVSQVGDVLSHFQGAVMIQLLFDLREFTFALGDGFS